MHADTLLPPLFLFAYLAIAGATGWLVFFPSAREAVARRLRRGARGLAGAGRQGMTRTQRGAGNAGAAVAAVLRRAAAAVRRHPARATGAIALLLGPLALVLAFRPGIGTAGFDGASGERNEVIAALLAGEQLVPPPPLPPEIFATQEVEQLRPALGSADRDWQRLDADFRQRLLTVFRSLREQGYTLALIEGYRSPGRQDYLASLGPSVTAARGFQGYHQFGLAADCAFYRNGRLVIDERDPWAMHGYQLYGEAAERAGLVWGGRWRMMDFGHIELRRPGVVSRN